jgi:hypothetical protein
MTRYRSLGLLDDISHRFGSPHRFTGSYPQGAVAGKLDCPIRMNVERPPDGMTQELALVVETWLFPHAFTGFMIRRA